MDLETSTAAYYDSDGLQLKIEDFNWNAAYEEWVSRQQWDWFLTVTSRHNLSIESARRVAGRMAQRIQLAGSGHRSPDEKDGALLWVAEPHKHASEGYHLHCLYKKPQPRFAGWTNKREFQFLLSVCRNAVGGQKWINRKGKLGLWHRIDIQPYKGKSAAEYCAKYITKDIADWDIHQIFHREA
jgi:hypothetical protein